MNDEIIKPEMLKWSRLRARLSEEKLAKKIGITPEKIQKIESGEEFLTFKQAQKWADSTHIPFGFLFLENPPEESLALPDLRTLANVANSTPSIDLLDTIKDALSKQDWYREYLLEQGYTELSFIGKFKAEPSVHKVVEHMKAILGGVENKEPLAHDKYFAELIDAAEQAGIMVMRSGVAGSGTNRKLDVGEFRGFAISDSLAPLVFINIADAPAARLFTLIHELAHLWVGTSGVSDVASMPSNANEKFCNAVAGEFLVAENSLRKDWNKDVNDEQQFKQLANKYKVSSLVIARRAMDLRLITKQEYDDIYLSALKKHNNEKKPAGGNYYAAMATKNSKNFSRAITAEALSNRMLLRDAARLLGLQPSKINKFAEGLKK